MDIAIEAAVEVTERDELLNGTQSITFAGDSDDGAWSITGAASWNLGLIDFTGEGDLVLSADDGSEIFATLVEARATSPEGEAGEADVLFRLRYEVDGGSGRFEEVAGSGSAEALLAGDTLKGRWVLALNPPT